jgi:hypothetical protein
MRMQEILSRCGYRCDLCLAYKPNADANPDNRQRLSDGWYRYFGFRIPPENIACDGCLAENPRLIDKACPVRPCVIEKNIATCAECGAYVCEKLKERLVVFEDIQKKQEEPIPAEDRRLFIFPYENKDRLENLRRSSSKK